jgi:capsular exopolysaccharide synthesis family protein
MADQRPITSNRVAAPTRPGPVAAADLTPKEVLGILRRKMLWIIILTIAGFIAGGATWGILKEFFPSYTARTYIEVLPPIQQDPMTISAVQLQRDILYGYRLSMANIIKQQSTLQELLKSDKVRNTKWFTRTNSGSTNKAVMNLDRSFVASAHRDSDFVEISMTCGVDEEAQLIVNEMLNLFITSQGLGKKKEIGDRLAQLEVQRARVENDLTQSETALDDVRKRWDITDLDRPIGRYFQHTITLKLNQLELEKNTLDLAIKQIEAEIQTLERIATSPIAEQIEHAIERDPVMLVLAEQLALQQARLDGAMTKFGENHREVRQINELISSIADERAQRKTVIANQTRRANLANGQDRLIILRQRFEELEKLRQDADAKKKDLDLARVQYEQRLKIRDERVAMLDSIKTQIEKLKIIHDDPETPKVRPVGLAPKPIEMVASRQWWIWFPGGTILGLLLGIAIAFLLEMANDLVRTPRDVIRYVRAPLLGVIPDSSEDSAVRGVDLCHVVRKAPYSILSESYRRCRTNLRLSGSAESLKAVLVTSGAAADGKTCVAVNLASALVAEDKKVLLIDGNFRKPSLQKLFPRVMSDDLEIQPISSGYGLSSFLMGQCGSKEVIRPSGIEGLDLIDAGLLPPNPAELLGNVRMDDLLKEQRKNYDHIIVDSPPVLLVSDAKVLGPFVDATVLVLNAAATKRGAAQRTLRELEEVGAKVVGCVLFGAQSMKGGYFQEQFKSYQKYQKAQVAGSPA